MTLQFAPPQSSLDKLDAALRRLVERHAFALVEEGAAFEAGEGFVLLLLTDDPQRSPESLDVAVVLPEALAALALPARCFAADSVHSPGLGKRYGVNRYPAVVALRDGAYLGAFSGILDWAPFVTELRRLAEAAPGRPPISIASQDARSCS
jgi:hydrogenase-1 operon protein HyaE